MVDPNELKAMVNNFYQTLYTSEEVQGMDEVLNHVPRKVSEDMNAMLNAEYTKDEVKQLCFKCSRLRHLDQTGSRRIFINATRTYVVTT